MSLSDWANIASSLSVIYFGWQQNRIFRQQNNIIAAQGRRSAPPESTTRPAVWIGRYWPTLVMAILIAANAYDVYDRHYDRHPPTPSIKWAAAQLQQEQVVYGQHFHNEEVVLDGKKFDHCTFENVTLIYHGTAPAELIDIQTAGSIMMRTDNDAIKTFVNIDTGMREFSGANTFGEGEIDENGNLTFHRVERTVPNPQPGSQAPNAPSSQGKPEAPPK
jgi:hypothetical protein